MLTREPLIDHITGILSRLESYLKLKSAQNLNDSAVLAEDVCKGLLNRLYGYNLTNLNVEEPNAPAVDLVDCKRRLAVQVTVNNKTEKIRKTHRTASEQNLGDNFDRIILLFLVNKAPAEPAPSGNFAPCTHPEIDVRDISTILADIRALDVAQMTAIADLLDEEIRNPAKPWNLDANIRPANLPYTSLGTLFKGRDAFLTDLHERLAGHSATLIKGHAIHGLGGVGKTRAAVEYAWRYRSHYTALLFVSADSPDTLDTKLAALCHAGILNLPEKSLTDQSEQTAAVLTWLNAHPGWLIILDNADTEDALTAVDQLLPKLSGGHVLITSRMTDYAGGIDAVPLDVLSDDDAAAFLLERTADHRTTAPDDDARALELAHELGGLALALEQSAAHIRKDRLSFAAYLDLWHSNTATALHWYNARTMHYPRSLAVTYQTSVDQLSEPAKEFFRVLSWLAPDPIPLTALEGDNAPADARALLAELENLSLARRDAAGTTFSVHRLVQEITRQQQAAFPPPPSALLIALVWLDGIFLGDSDDVRNWALLDPLAPHARTAALCAAANHIPEPTAHLLNQIAILYYSKAQHVVAEPLMRQALAIWETSLGMDHPQAAAVIGNLAGLLMATNRLVEAEPLMRQTLTIMTATYGMNHPHVATATGNLAQLLKATNRIAEAEPLMRQTLAIMEVSLGTDHPNVATAMNNLALLLQDTNRIAEAEPLMRQALAIWEASLGITHPQVATAIGNLALLLKATNRLTEAEPLMRQALAILEASFGMQHPQVAATIGNLAGVLKATNRIAEAEPLMRQALAILETSLGKDHPKVATAIGNLALLLKETNRHAEAEPLMRQALAMDEASYGRNHPEVAIRLNNLALLLMDTRRHAEAEPLMRRALEITVNFNIATGHEHPRLNARCGNYRIILTEMGDTQAEAEDKISKILAPVHEP
jgi:tetratricopeptide (TPR) repeat protein